MFTKTVELGDLRLTSEQDKLQLSICASAEFQLPDRFSTSVDKEIIRELTDGGIWASHRVQCHLKLVLSIDGKFVQGSQSFHLIEAIAYRLRNAPMWNQLALLALVDVQHPSPADEETAHVSIALNRGQKHEDGNMASEADAEIDVHPPESVWCAKFIGLRIQFNFSSIRVQDVLSKSVSVLLPVTPLRRDLLPNQQMNPGDTPQSASEAQAPDSSKKGLPKSKKWKTLAPKTPLSKDIMLLNDSASPRTKNKPAPKTPLSKEIMLLDEPVKLKKRGAILPKTPLSRQIMLLEEPLDSEDVIHNPPTPIANLSLLAKTPESSNIPRKSKSAPVKKQGKRKAQVPSHDPFIKQEVVESSISTSMMQTPSNKRQKSSPETPTPKPVSKLPGKKGATTKTVQNHEILRTWVKQNRKDPYPTKAQMQTLLTDTGYSKGHMLSLLRNIRASVLPTIIKIEPDLIPSPETPLPSQAEPSRLPLSIFKLAINLGLEDEMLLDESDDAPYDIENDDMLFDPVDESLPWFDSISPSSPTSGVIYYELEPLESENAVANLTSGIPIPMACQLTETALRFIVGGEQRIRRGAKASPAHPELSLSILIPSLFDSSFKKLMVQNARFLPTITATICVTMVKNKQGAELRKKLFLLAFAAKELDEDPHGSASVHAQRKMRMQHVVQRRLWSMMHRKLQDTHRARNLRHTTSDGVKNRPVFEDNEDLFAGLDADYDSQDSQASQDSQDSQDSQLTIVESDDGEGEFVGLLDNEMEPGNRGDLREDDPLNDSSSLILDEDDDFEDIFLSTDHDNGGLLSYLDEMEAGRERREIERATEEMLLDDFPDGDDDMLPGDFPGNDDMLFEYLSHDSEAMLLDDSYLEGLANAGEEEIEENTAFFVRTRSTVEAPLGVGWR